jgi:hypothetical protein
MEDPVEQANNFLTIGGVVLLAIGAEFESALLINIALVALGGGLLAGGIKTFLRPELRFWNEGLSLGERNAAMGEYLWALAFVLLGMFEMVFPAGFDRWWTAVLDGLPRPPEIY